MLRVADECDGKRKLSVRHALANGVVFKGRVKSVCVCVRALLPAAPNAVRPQYHSFEPSQPESDDVFTLLGPHSLNLCRV